jgi:hypothetical protein
LERVLPWLAVVFAATIAVVAVFEIDMRSEEGQLALEPTAIPSPATTAGPETPLSEAPTTPTSQAEATAAPTEPPATPEPTATAAPVETETPAPTVEAPTASPPHVTATRPMPHTGGGAVGGGSVVFALAAALRFVVRRSY